jgi:hypothetical protein
MKTKLVLGQYPLGADTVVVTNIATHKEVCRVTAEASEEESPLNSFYAMKKLVNSLDTLPRALNALTRLVEKVERIQSITQTGGKVRLGDLMELSAIAADGRELIEAQKMFDLVSLSGYTIKESDLKGFYFENEFSADGEASEDFPTRPEAIGAAFQKVMSQPISH